jgi:hypothetical protein
MVNYSRLVLGSLLFLGVAGYGRPAEADVYCGASNPNVDVPSGNLVTSQSQNTIITPVITQALHEFRTHSMLMTHNLFTHASMKVPSTSSSAPHLNPDQLRWGNPGASQIDVAAAYTYLHSPSNGGLNWIGQQWGGYPGNNDGARVADWIWFNMPYRWVAHTCQSALVQSGTQYYDCNGALRTAPYSFNGYTSVQRRAGGGYYRLQASWGGMDITYRLNQFLDIKRVNFGDPGDAFCNNQGCYNQDGPGAVCSTLISYAVAKALPGRAVQAFLYSAETSLAALTVLGNKIFSDCKNGLDWYQDAWCWFSSACDSGCNEAKNQVIRCFLNKDDCYASGAYYVPPGARARSVSPDQLAGWRPGQDWVTPSINSPWSLYDPVSVNFSGGGTVYSCWTGG